MYVKYCPHCNGYTIKLKTKKCPVCQRTLEQRQGESTALFGKRLEEMKEASCGEGSGQAAPEKMPERERGQRSPEQRENRHTEAKKEQTGTGRTGRQHSAGKQRTSASRGRRRIVSGRICDYSNVSAEAGSYRRFWFQKIHQAIVYHQRTEDVLHRFRVHTADDKDIFVNMHGTISSGAALENNLNVTVSGKCRNGFLMADRASIEYAGSRVPVRMQHCFQMLLPITILLVILCMAGGILTSGFSAGGIQGSIRSLTAFCHDFIQTFIIAYIALLVIYFLIIWPRRRRRYFYRQGNPFFTCFILAIIVTLLLMNVAGLGDMAAQAASGAAISLEDFLIQILPSIGVLLLTIWGIIMMIRAVL
ncbi:MAG: hypothetical protein Q4E89_06055 [Eubacteriales bacterium]|nr:hypothetical protein [Eubacteriales bacterium]